MRQQATPLARVGVAGADADGRDVRQRPARALGRVRDPGERRAQVLLDVDRERSQRRDVEDARAAARARRRARSTSRSIAHRNAASVLPEPGGGEQERVRRRARSAASPPPARRWARRTRPRTRPGCRGRTPRATRRHHATGNLRHARRYDAAMRRALPIVARVSPRSSLLAPARPRGAGRHAARRRDPQVVLVGDVDVPAGSVVGEVVVIRGERRPSRGSSTATSIVVRGRDHRGGPGARRRRVACRAACGCVRPRRSAGACWPARRSTVEAGAQVAGGVTQGVRYTLGRAVGDDRRAPRPGGVLPLDAPAAGAPAPARAARRSSARAGAGRESPFAVRRVGRARARSSSRSAASSSRRPSSGCRSASRSSWRGGCSRWSGIAVDDVDRRPPRRPRAALARRRAVRGVGDRDGGRPGAVRERRVVVVAGLFGLGRGRRRDLGRPAHRARLARGAEPGKGGKHRAGRADGARYAPRRWRGRSCCSARVSSSPGPTTSRRPCCAAPSGDGSVAILPTASATEGDDVFDRWGAMGLDHYAEAGIAGRGPAR